MSDETDNSEFFCPITCAVMEDPVIDPDGNSYERKAIEEWLTRHAVSPITRNALSADQLIPNRALRASIERDRSTIPTTLPGMTPLDVSKHEDA
jgi:hypothetical protein